jgi:hypothetical protein
LDMRPDHQGACRNQDRGPTGEGGRKGAELCRGKRAFPPSRSSLHFCNYCKLFSTKIICYNRKYTK